MCCIFHSFGNCVHSPVASHYWTWDLYFFFQFLLMAVISKKNLSKMSTHPTFELRQDDTSDEGKKTKHNVE